MHVYVTVLWVYTHTHIHIINRPISTTTYLSSVFKIHCLHMHCNII